MPLLATTVTARIDVPRDALFEVFIPIELKRILYAAWPVPAVVGTSAQSGPWDVVGSSRTVHLADGSTAREAVTRVERPATFGYRVHGFTNPLGRLAREAHGTWTFAEVRGATDVAWTYAFVPRNRAAALLLTAVVNGPWRRFMTHGLAAFARLAQDAAAQPPRESMPL